MRRNLKRAVTGIYQKIEYDSLEELAFLQWAFELKRGGYIKSIERAGSFLLSDSLNHDFVVNLKTKSKPASEIVLRGHSYTAEFLIEWDKKAMNKFFDIIGSSSRYICPIIGTNSNGKYQSFIEIKPMFDQNNMERLFKLNQKWMWQKHALFINLVKCPELFQSTFTPTEYLTTRTGKNRIIRWKTKSLSSFLRE